MNCKDCKIVCDGKEVAKISCSNEGIKIEPTKEGKSMLKNFCNCKDCKC